MKKALTIIFLSSLFTVGCKPKIREKTMASQVVCYKDYTLFAKTSPMDDELIVTKYCCKFAILSSCGLTLAACQEPFSAVYCEQNMKCVSGDQCQTLPEWVMNQ